jgi:hypothetical protein
MITLFHGTASIGQIADSGCLDVGFGGRNYSRATGFLRTVGGVYVTDRTHEAVDYATRAIENGTGTDPGVVVIETLERDLLADEDTLKLFMRRSLQQMRSLAKNQREDWADRAKLFGDHDPDIEPVVDDFIRLQYGNHQPPSDLKNDVWTFMTILCRANAELPWSFSQYRNVVNRIARRMPSMADPWYLGMCNIMSPSFRIPKSVPLDGPQSGPRIVGIARIKTIGDSLLCEEIEILAGTVDEAIRKEIERSWRSSTERHVNLDDDAELNLQKFLDP